MSTSSLIRALTRELKAQFPNNAPSFQLVQQAVSCVLEAHPKELNLYSKLFDATLVGHSQNEPYIVNVIYAVQDDSFSVATCKYGYSRQKGESELHRIESTHLNVFDVKALKKFEKSQRKFSLAMGYDVLWIQQSSLEQDHALQQSLQLLKDFPPHQHIGIFNFSFASSQYDSTGPISDNGVGLGVSVMSYHGPYLPLSFRYYVGFVESTAFFTASSNQKQGDFNISSTDEISYTFAGTSESFKFEYMSLLSTHLGKSSFIYDLLHRELAFNFERLKCQFIDQPIVGAPKDIPLYGYQPSGDVYRGLGEHSLNLTLEEKKRYPSKYQALTPATRFNTDFFEVKKGWVKKRFEINSNDGATNILERAANFKGLLNGVLMQ